MPSIKDQKILIIGGSSGIGAAVAKLAAAEGVEVAIASSNPSRVQTAVEKIQSAVPNAKVSGYTIDVNQDDVEERLDKLLTEVTTAFGSPLDHIIYTAAVLDIRPISAVTVDYLRSSVQFGFVVPLIIAKLAGKYIKSSYTSSIIFTSGRIAEKPMKGATVAAGWATGLFGLTKTLALDLAPIRVNLVSPGTTDTEMQGSGEARVQRMAMAAKASLLGKVGTPEEVAEAYLYYMKDSNNTGSWISTSGGALLQ
jgi:NAD(P)-dependent dehydrogenase (short-subunit alcohol dehydrogenase family)